MTWIEITLHHLSLFDLSLEAQDEPARKSAKSIETYLSPDAAFWLVQVLRYANPSDFDTSKGYFTRKAATVGLSAAWGLTI